MKKFLSVVFATMLVASLSAQVEFGAKAGYGLSNYNISVKDVSLSFSLGNQSGYYVGGVAVLPLNDTWSLQSELIYSFEGTRLSIKNDFIKDVADSSPFKDDISLHLNTHNIRIPVMFKYNANENLSVMAGPYINYMVGIKADVDSKTESTIKENTEEGEFDNYKNLASDILKENIAKIDAGLTLAIDYKFANGLFIDARYNLGVVNAIKSELDLSAIDPEMSNINLKDSYGVAPTVKYSSIQIGVGFMF